MLSQVLRPGAYRCVCVELEVHHLAVAAILAAENLGALEGGDGAPAVGGPPALAVLRRLVENWLRDATQNSNP